MKMNIAIVAGGDSGEYEISLNSAKLVQSNLDREKFTSYLIVMKGKEWYCKHPHGIFQVDKNDFSLTIQDKKIQFDCVFIAIHGTPGEDGKLQGYFEMLDIPYTTSDWIASALTFDKYHCKTIVRSFDVDVPADILLHRHDLWNVNEVMEEIHFPCFVKPNKGGSSLGMTKVINQNDLKNAIELAFREDNEVLVEQFIEGREITCGVFRYSNHVYALPITEIVSKKDFFDYEAKYEGMADEITPADLEENIDWECKTISTLLYNKLNLRSVVRFDFIFNNSGMYFLEVNTVPGFSEASIVPQQAVEMGYTLQEFFGMLIEEAMGWAAGS